MSMVVCNLSLSKAELEEMTLNHSKGFSIHLSWMWKMIKLWNNSQKEVMKSPSLVNFKYYIDHFIYIRKLRFVLPGGKVLNWLIFLSDKVPICSSVVKFQFAPPGLIPTLYSYIYPILCVLVLVLPKADGKMGLDVQWF